MARPISFTRRTIVRRTLAAGGAATAGLSLLAARDATASTPVPRATPGATPAGTPAAREPTILVRVEYVGGFVALENGLTATPTYQLTDDGQEISQGVQVQVYPPPALPSLQSARLTDAGVEAVLGAARTAGLTDHDQEFVNPNVTTDLPNQIITVAADGRTVTTTLYGLDRLDPADTSELAAARDRIQPFLSLLANPPSLRPTGQVAAPETFYEFAELQIVAVPADELPAAGEQSTLEGVTPTAPIAWPLTVALSDFGIPLSEAVGGEGYAGAFPDARVDTVGGSDLEAILPLAQQANQLTIWDSDGGQWVLLLRPLLPGEIGNLARPAAEGDQPV